MSSIREQIAAKRAEAKRSGTPVRGGSAIQRGVPVPADSLDEERTLSDQIRKGIKSGKLDISAFSLDRIPSDVYTALLGIPRESLARPASPPPTPAVDLAIRPRPGGAAGHGKMDHDRVFGQTRRETWAEPGETTSFKAADNRIREIDVEFGAFGGLRTLDLSRNALDGLPDSIADLLKLSSLDLSNNAFTAVPPAILLLPALQVLDLSHNALSVIDLSSPVEPSDEGLSYGAGFLSTSFSRNQNKKPLTVLPAMRHLNLGHNRLTNEGLAELCLPSRLASMRVLNLESNALQGSLDTAACGIDAGNMPELAQLILNNNARLRDTIGEMARSVKVEMEGCGALAGRSAGTSTQSKAESQASAGDAPSKPAGNSVGAGIPLPDLTTTYRTCPAATFDSEPLNIQFDLYLPPSPAASGSSIPLVIWFHGGGLLQGNKENLPPHFRRLPQHAYADDQHVAVLSPNYRLAPQVPIIDILSDITALLAFVRTKLQDRLAKQGRGDYVIDTDRICLSGGSAGGYLALIAGLPVPKSATDEAVGGYRGENPQGIKCLAPFYPITDLTDTFWSTETNPVPWFNRSVSHAEAKPHIDTKAAPVDSAVSGGPRSILYPYMLQHSLFPSLLFKAQRGIGHGLDAFRPTPEALSITHRLKLLADAGQSLSLPVYLIYGDSDTAVQRFDTTVERLKAVSSDLLEIEVRPGVDHAFDEDEAEECAAFRDWLGRTLL